MCVRSSQPLEEELEEEEEERNKERRAHTLRLPLPYKVKVIYKYTISLVVGIACADGHHAFMRSVGAPSLPYVPPPRLHG